MPPLIIHPAKGRKRPGKYGNVKTADGFDSVRERTRAQELKLMERAGLITDLRRQVLYELIPAQYGQCVKDGKGRLKRPLLERALHYRADFVYRDAGTGQEVVEDVKGYRTKEYIIKRKLMLFIHGIRIKEIT
ncbi:MAG: DUF1064 domain-containing protein [Bacteroides sp.]|nr:DUF1064 domain-containing protein [Bacteroides sp.]